MQQCDEIRRRERQKMDIKKKKPLYVSREAFMYSVIALFSAHEFVSILVLLSESSKQTLKMSTTSF